MRTKEFFEYIEVDTIDRIDVFCFHICHGHPLCPRSLSNRIPCFIFSLPGRNENRYIILTEVFVCGYGRSDFCEIRKSQRKAEFFLYFTNGRCFGSFSSFGTTSEKSPSDHIFPHISPILHEDRGIISIEDHDADNSRNHRL